MACSGCSRRRASLLSASKEGIRVTKQIADRIRRTVGSTTDKKYDNIKMTQDGVIKQCSQCGKQSDPAPTAGQIPNLSCEDCKV